jgi:hypothetical protein
LSIAVSVAVDSPGDYDSGLRVPPPARRTDGSAPETPGIFAYTGVQPCRAASPIVTDEHA